MVNKSKKSILLVAIVVLMTIMSMFVLTACKKNDNNGDNNNNQTTQTNSTYYDFYLTLGTMPTLYATLNAYENKNPNTYMWFFRGNTISYDYSADFIHYFSTQSKDNNNSEINYQIIRDKVREIKKNDKNAKFRLFCDDLRTRFIFDIFVAAGVDFEDLDVTLLSDGTGTYTNYGRYRESASEVTSTSEWDYSACPKEWNTIMKAYMDNRSKADYCYWEDKNGQAMEIQHLAFYASTFANVKYWIQHPDYLSNNHFTKFDLKCDMNLVKKDPKKMYTELDNKTRDEYKKVVLANALVNNTENLQTLEDVVKYFDDQLANNEKESVVILGSGDPTLKGNQQYIEQTIAFYTPTRLANDETQINSADDEEKTETKVTFKGEEYIVDKDATTITVEGKEYVIGELGVKLFFKGHPGHPADEAYTAYLKGKDITILPYRTPVEVLYWLYDVKTGGYESTAYLSCAKGQIEFNYGGIGIPALIPMKELGFFENTAIFD